MRAMKCMFIITSLLLAPRNASAQGALSQIREDVRTQSSQSKSSEEKSASRHKNRKRCNHSYGCDCEDDSLFGSLLGKALFYAVGSPFWAPPKMVKDDYSSAGYFSEYPYQDGIDGYMMIVPWLPLEPSSYSLQARTEYGDDFDSVSRIGSRILLDTTTRFGVDSEVNYWRESIGSGRYDDLWTGDANLVFRFAQSTRLQMRTGLGMNWIADDLGSDIGFNFTYQGDFFPRKPWVISAELDLGRIGEATLCHGRITTGVQWRRAEVFIGYDYYELGTTELNGLASGLRWRF